MFKKELRFAKSAPRNLPLRVKGFQMCSHPIRHENKACWQASAQISSCSFLTKSDYLYIFPPIAAFGAPFFLFFNEHNTLFSDWQGLLRRILLHQKHHADKKASQSENSAPSSQIHRFASKKPGQSACCAADCQKSERESQNNGKRLQSV